MQISIKLNLQQLNIDALLGKTGTSVRSIPGWQKTVGNRKKRSAESELKTGRCLFVFIYLFGCGNPREKKHERPERHCSSFMGRGKAF